MDLPIDFKDKIKKYFKSEADDFLNSYNFKPQKSIRVNTLKMSVEEFLNTFKLDLEPTNFSADGFFIKNSFDEKLGHMPLHHAGAFYVQEASAMTPVLALDINKDDKVLDLCAAPGGKSTQVAACLKGSGLIWSNEFIKSRALTLLSNIERMGIKNAVVSSCNPETLCENLYGFFDKVLVDAPCSGEGMFRKNPKALTEWSKEHVLSCSLRQKLILNSAKNALKEGGILVYSTCTFSPEENEEIVCDFLKNNDNFELVDINYSFGRPAFSEYTFKNSEILKIRRITPLDGGEGHFIAKLRKKESFNKKTIKYYNYKKENKSILNLRDFLKNISYSNFEGIIEKFNNKYLLLPESLPSLSGLNVLRVGLLLAEDKKSRIEPSHALFMASTPDELFYKVNLNNDEILKYLKGEEIKINNDFKGFAGVTINNEIVTGFGKCSNGILKNKYPKGLRNNI